MSTDEGVQGGEAQSSRMPGRPRPAVLILAALGVAAIAFAAWVLWPSGSGDTDGGVGEETRTQDQNGVTVKATRLAGEGAPVHFVLVLDTHTVDLSRYDPVQKVVLVVGGRTLTAQGTSSVDQNTGHHVEAELSFDTEPGQAMTLVVKDLGGVPERRLEFGA